MNYKLVLNNLGKILIISSAFMLFPLLISLCYKEFDNVLPFIIPIIIMLTLGIIMSVKKTKNRNMSVKDGLAIVGLSWIIMSIFGCLPFVISGDIPHFVDALFETVSGFSTTGSTILTDIESLSKGMLFWRSFTHFIGGMGILVFVLAILPKTEGRDMHIFRAESPGPQVGKITAKITATARILYIIYTALTIIQVIALLCCKIGIYDSLVTAFATAGTGGFSVLNASIAGYNSVAVEIICGIFMMLFGVNFSIYYFLLIGNVAQALRNEELRWYLCIIAVSTILISINIFSIYQNVGETLRYSFFQVSSIITTTGFVTADFSLWPTFSQMMLLFLMFVGASAGSTGGGLKVSRVVLLFKTTGRDVRRLLSPRNIKNVRFEGKSVDEGICRNVYNYLIIYISIILISTLLLCLFDAKIDILSNFTAIITTINNVGPGLGAIAGPVGNFSTYSVPSKLIMIFNMLAGRLELYPILLLFSPTLWSKKK